MKVYCDYGSRAGLQPKITVEIRNLDLDAERNILYTESSKTKYLTFTKDSEFYNFVTGMKTCTVDVSITLFSGCGFLFSKIIRRNQLLFFTFRRANQDC
jgi:hypothetical protein